MYLKWGESMRTPLIASREEKLDGCKDDTNLFGYVTLLFNNTVYKYLLYTIILFAISDELSVALLNPFFLGLCSCYRILIRNSSADNPPVTACAQAMFARLTYLGTEHILPRES